MTLTTSFKNGLVAATLLGFAGCSGNQSTTTPESSSAVDEYHHHEAPHDGHIVELGSEDYHAELTHDDETHAVGIYILDSEAKNLVPIDASTVTINVAVDNQPAQYSLAAVRQMDDPADRSSYFELVSEALCDSWDAPGATARLNVVIDGKPYTGQIEVDEHDHGDHAHE